ncbi:MAG TPA: adenine deaminase [Phycisphaerae bacterium]|nr:adenine deaminase [Phycisphaerae bacterium]
MGSEGLASLIDVAAGRRPADVVLRGGQVVNVASCEIHGGDVALVGESIAGIGQYEGHRTIDVSGQFICPGLIDAHVHIESSLLAVDQFARVVSAHGTTSVIADPHEFANVMGTEGISYVLRTAKYAPIDVFVMLSSCVPASPLESAGAELSSEDLEPFLANPWVLGLAEMMNYPGVIDARPDVLDKLTICRNRVIDGHAPSVTGQALTAYAAAGIASDHECIRPEEAVEKLRRGFSIMIREGSQTRNLEALLPVVTPATADRFMFCTDDKDVRDLLAEGQIDHMIRKAISLGMDPVLAVKLGGHTAAQYFGLRRRGAVLPGYQADLTIVDDLRSFRVRRVFHRGNLVAEDGRSCVAEKQAPTKTALRSSVNVHRIEPKDFEIAAPPAEKTPHIHVIQVMENRIDTERRVEPATVLNGKLVADPSRDLAKIVVLERHRASGEVGRGFVNGFNLQAGAIGSTVAHDAHNMIVVGMSDADMLAAAVHLVKLHGGLVVVRDGQVLADVPLPIAGLVSEEPAATVAQRLASLGSAARSLGCRLEQPFMALSFLSLSVIGKLKVTNQGLIDVERFAAIPLFVGSVGDRSRSTGSRV